MSARPGDRSDAPDRRPGGDGRDALRQLVRLLREDGSVIAAHLSDPSADPVLGELVAAGPRAAGAPAEYALLVEAIREGYLLHYGAPRVVSGAGDDLRLLAGDYLYALGLERLAALGDLQAVHELADLISLCAHLHSLNDDAGAATTLWLASVVAVATGPAPSHEAAKEALRAGRPGAVEALASTARESAARGGLADLLPRAAEAIESPPLSERHIG